MEAIEFLIAILIIWVILFVIDIIETAKNTKSQKVYVSVLEEQNKILKGIILNVNDEDEEFEDQGAMKAINTIIKYCEDHHECEGCILDCTMLKKGSAPCFWTPPQVEEDNIREAIAYFEGELESVKSFPAQALLVVQDERKHLETALGVLRKAQDGK